MSYLSSEVASDKYEILSNKKYEDNA